METLFIYLIKASSLVTMFYLSYHILLRKETFFNSNRWFLMVGLITSAGTAVGGFTKTVWVEPTPTTFDWSKIPVTTNGIENEGFEINWYLVFAIVYGLGILGFLSKFAFDFYSLSKVLKGKTIQRQADFKFIDISENVSPFSYFNSIVYNSSLYSETELENILEHEKVHSSQHHTLDVLISRLFSIVFWLNPLMWLYKKAVIQNLEFIADSEASKKIADKKAYQLTLLKITTQKNCVAITNHFYQSLIKKRIVMLNKNQSNKRNSWKYAVVLPLLGAFLFLFQVKVVAQEKDSEQVEIKLVKIDITNIIITKNTTDKEIKKHCKQIKKMYNIDLSFFNIKRNSNSEIISIESEFKDKTGSGSCIQAENTPIKPFKFFYDKNKKEMGYDMDLTSKQESNVIQADSIYFNTLSKGKEIYITGDTLIVPSKLITKQKVTKRIPTNEKAVKITTKTINQSADNFDIKHISKQKPIIILNGKKTEANFNISNVDISKIESINVLKGKMAIEKYGDEGKNGVIEITADKPDQITKKVVTGFYFEPNASTIEKKKTSQ